VLTGRGRPEPRSKAGLNRISASKPSFLPRHRLAPPQPKLMEHGGELRWW
jgi:hypothetical protein